MKLVFDSQSNVNLFFVFVFFQANWALPELQHSVWPRRNEWHQTLVQWNHKDASDEHPSLGHQKVPTWDVEGCGLRTPNQTLLQQIERQRHLQVCIPPPVSMYWSCLFFFHVDFLPRSNGSVHNIPLQMELTLSVYDPYRWTEMLF